MKTKEWKNCGVVLLGWVDYLDFKLFKIILEYIVERKIELSVKGYYEYGGMISEFVYGNYKEG